MSGPDEPERDKGFLARWSQRKLEAKQPERKPATSAPENVESPPAPSSAEPEPEFDLSSLPKLEELTGSTDITAFLRKSVPEHLRNAALQRSWALDPAIRNYVSPALEYAYDWNAPGGVPGGSEPGVGGDVARIVAQIMGEAADETVESDTNAVNETAGSMPHEQEAPPTQQPEPVLQTVRRDEESIVAIESASKVQEVADARASLGETDQTNSVAPQQPVRRHGTAKPIV
jgi:hypothetical protein